MFFNDFSFLFAFKKCFVVSSYCRSIKHTVWGKSRQKLSSLFIKTVKMKKKDEMHNEAQFVPFIEWLVLL